MGFREKMAANPKPYMIGVGAIVVLSLAWIGYSLRGDKGMSEAERRVTEMFYTEDDGATYFTDAFEKLSTDFKGPNGKEAVGAYVFQFSDEKPFVGYMEKYTPRGKKILAQFYSNPANKGVAPPETVELNAEKLVKKPGNKTWVSIGRGGEAVANITMLPRKNDDVAMRLAPE